MNKAEAKILHGLYWHREMVGEEVPYSAGELNWLVNSSFRQGKRWLGPDNRLHSFESPADSALASMGLTTAAAERPLTYLKSKGFISYTKSNGNFRVAITGAGADTARELDTIVGRANLLYRKHKDGIIWFLATILVSAITAWITKSEKNNPSPRVPNPTFNSDPTGTAQSHPASTTTPSPLPTQSRR